MAFKEIVFTIGPEGGVTIEANGYTGTECQKATARFEERLGKSFDPKLKQEFYEESNEEQVTQCQQVTQSS